MTRKHAAPWWLRHDALIIFVVTVFAFSSRLHEAHFSGTEGHRVIPALQMVMTGDWLVPRLWGVEYLAKPPLHHWTLAVFHAITGSQSEWILRFPSALAAGALGALLCVMGNLWFRRPVGFIAGISVLFFVANWAQNVKADIDGPHTLTAVAAALGFLHLGTRRQGDITAILLTALAFGAMLLHKGPAGMPLIAGAILAPTIVGTDRRAWRRPAIWIAVAAGTAIFLIWAGAAYFAIERATSDGDQSGVREVVSRIGTRTAGDLLKSMALPFVLFAYGLPITLLIPFGWMQRTARCVAADEVDEPLARLRLRSLIVAVAVAVVIAMIANLVNPRYNFILFPLLCPVAGAVITAWLRKAYRPSNALRLRQIGTGTAIGMLIAVCIVSVLFSREHHVIDVGLVLHVLIVAGSAGGAVWLFIGQRTVRALVMMSIAITFFIPIHTHYRSVGSEERSCARFANLMRDHVYRGERVLADDWVMTSPELFLYADIDVYYKRDELSQPVAPRRPRWLVLHETEWERWKTAFPAQFTEVYAMPINRHEPVLVEFVPDGFDAWTAYPNGASSGAEDP
ncbi:MAG: glycosyltransferase family 39 protein [Phycisphaerales bacterium]|nr:glycosyltransferase family 39 protein [Phycisphaerales bacterium]